MTCSITRDKQNVRPTVYIAVSYAETKYRKQLKKLRPRAPKSLP